MSKKKKEPEGFRITCSEENCRKVYRVYHSLTKTRIWSKFDSREKAESYVRTMENLMKDDCGSIDPKVRI